MSASKHNPWSQVVLTLVFTVGVLGVLASAVDMDPPATASAGHAPVAAVDGQEAPAAAADHGDSVARMGAFDRLKPTKLDNLACFQCHDRQRFEHGEKFPHATHREEGAGHCHRCHAFQGHFEVIIRKATCEECH